MPTASSTPIGPLLLTVFEARRPHAPGYLEGLILCSQHSLYSKCSSSVSPGTFSLVRASSIVQRKRCAATLSSGELQLTPFFQQVNRLNVSLFTPSLLFSKVAFFLSPGVCSLSAFTSLVAQRSRFRRVLALRPPCNSVCPALRMPSPSSISSIDTNGTWSMSLGTRLARRV